MLLERKLLWLVLQEAQPLLLALAEVRQREGDQEGAAWIAALARETAERFGLGAYSACVAPLCNALDRRDAAESLALLEELLAAMEAPWDLGASPLYRHTGGQYGDPSRQMQRMRPALLAELENDPKYDFLRGEEAFRRLLRQYRGMPGDA